MWKYFFILGFGGLFSLSVFILQNESGFFSEKPDFSSEFRALAYDDLSGWSNDQQGAALQAFQKSCELFITQRPTAAIEPKQIGGTVSDWLPVCRLAMDREGQSHQEARRFFEENFTLIAFSGQEEGLFTGYYAPEYQGSEQPTEEYSYPLYALPSDLKIVDLGQFSRELNGKSIIGEIKEGEFIPYKDRKLIDKGALADQELELVWLKDPVDAFFMHIQGSGVIRLPDGQRKLLGYAGKNGKAYQAIGKFLIENGDISREDMSMQAIRSWIDENPGHSQDLMWKNPSYVFFRPLTEKAPVGSQNVELTPGRSLAVDRDYVPLGIPVWLDLKPANKTSDPLRRLVIAQDTGGAIKGRVRGDLYWGIGDDAELMAGPMKDQGRYYFLLPTHLANRLLSEGFVRGKRP